MRARHGPPSAITGTAHKLARIIYFMLKEQKPYSDSGADYYEFQHRNIVLRNLNRKAAKLGFRLEPAIKAPVYEVSLEPPLKSQSAR